MNSRRPPQWLLSAGIWTGIGVVSGVQIQLSMLSHGHSLARIVLCQVLVWNAWIAISIAIEWVLRRLPLAPPRPAAILAHLAIAVAFGAAHAAWWVGCELLVVPYDFMNPTSFANRYDDILLGLMPMAVALYCIVVAAFYATQYYRMFRERELLAEKLERSLSEARLSALETQIQPHFLFNTLNAVSTLVRVGQNTQAVGMIAGLSDLLRYALDRAGDAQVRLEDEVAMARRYLEIQQLRFGDRLSFDIAVTPEAARAGVPVLLLQPLVENAVSHGIASRQAPGRVAVSAARHDSELRIEVFNTGVLPESVRPGIGLSNTRARLEQIYDGRSRLELSAADGGVRTLVTIPWTEVP